MSAYYNEFDPQAAAWLRELIKQGLIADGEVDERSIADVKPEDLQGFTQCHFFAGIGGWSYALRLAGWADDRAVWTGSPPCQPFSNAGKRKGQDDLRHLWPVFFDLVKVGKPPVIFGEQVAAAIRTGWLDDLQNDLEAENYATGKIVLPACIIGAPHIRQRIWFVAERVDNPSIPRPQGHAGNGDTSHEPRWLNSESGRPVTETGSNGGLADTDSSRPHQGQKHDPTTGYGNTATAKSGDDRPESTDAPESIWRNPDWLFCRDGKWRPVECSVLGIFNGLPDELVRSCNISPACNPFAKDQEARVMRLKGYGNAIVPPLAAEVIRAYMEADLEAAERE